MRKDREEFLKKHFSLKIIEIFRELDIPEEARKAYNLKAVSHEEAVAVLNYTILQIGEKAYLTCLK